MPDVKLQNEDKLILDLCGGTGSWSEPYRKAGYMVVVVDPEYSGEGRLTETVEEFCERELVGGSVHGILAAPPCTQFCSSGARWWREKKENDPLYLEKALGTVFACLEVIKRTEPAWWALENPVGRLSSLLGPPVMKFDPFEFGDGYTKKTCLWGDFTSPRKAQVEADRSEDRYNNPKNFFDEVAPELGSFMARMAPSGDRSKLRSITPPGFATAFFKANP